MAMANETVTLLRAAKIPGLGWRRGKAIISKTGRVKPDSMFLGRGRRKKEVHAPEGHYVLRHFDGRLPRHKKLGNDPTEALDELERAQSELKLKNSAKAIGYIIPSPVPVKRKSLAECGRDFLELKRSPSLDLHEDTIKLYTNIVDEFVPISRRTYPEDVTEGDVIRYCDELDERYSDGVRARRYTSLRGFLFYCGLEPKRLITASVHKRLKSYEKKKVRIYSGAAARLSPSADRAAGQVPQDRGPRSQAKSRAALRGSGRCSALFGLREKRKPKGKPAK